MAVVMGSRAENDVWRASCRALEGWSAGTLLCHVGCDADPRRYMNAAKYGLDRVFFSGCFIRGERDATSCFP
jgi:hypothetical protein